MSKDGAGSSRTFCAFADGDSGKQVCHWRDQCSLFQEHFLSSEKGREHEAVNGTS